MSRHVQAVKLFQLHRWQWRRNWWWNRDTVWYFNQLFWQSSWEWKLKLTIILMMMIYCEQIIPFSCSGMSEITRTSVLFRIRLIRLNVIIKKLKKFIVSYSYHIQFSIMHRWIRNFCWTIWCMISLLIKKYTESSFSGS